jgi:hypothetical protein
MSSHSNVETLDHHHDDDYDDDDATCPGHGNHYHFGEKLRQQKITTILHMRLNRR